MSRQLLVTGILFLVVMLTGVSLFVAEVHSSNLAQAVITVNSTLDNLNFGDGSCTLREAIMNANSDSDITSKDCVSGSDNDIITVPAGTYSLAITGVGEDGNLTGDLDITDDLTLNGAGSISTTIDANQLDRVFHVLNGAAVYINDLTITEGLVTNESGGGLLNSNGYLTLTNSLVSHNVVAGKDLVVGGGGVASIALTGATSTSLENSEVYSNTNNSWFAFSGGGGVFVSTKADLTAQLTISNSIVHNNLARNSGGGLYALSQATGSGQLQIWMERSTIDGNTAEGSGGGLMLRRLSGNIDQLKSRIIDSTLSNNLAGGIHSQSGVGGGMYSTGETLVVRSAIYGNRVGRIHDEALGSGGGIGSFGTLEVVNSTISDNHADGESGSIGLEGVGGGIASVSLFTITNSSVAHNTAAIKGGGIATAALLGPATTTFENTIVADNSALSDASCTNLFGVQNSGGYNLEDGNTCNFTMTGDQFNINPHLGPLQDNGGDTFTNALLSGSPAIDAGDCPGTSADQRGLSRPVDIPNVANVADACDIGAFEVQLQKWVYLPIIIKP